MGVLSDPRRSAFWPCVPVVSKEKGSEWEGALELLAKLKTPDQVACAVADGSGCESKETVRNTFVIVGCILMGYPRRTLAEAFSMVIVDGRFWPRTVAVRGIGRGGITPP